MRGPVYIQKKDVKRIIKLEDHPDEPRPVRKEIGKDWVALKQDVDKLGSDVHTVVVLGNFKVIKYQHGEEGVPNI